MKNIVKVVAVNFLSAHAAFPGLSSQAACGEHIRWPPSDPVITPSHFQELLLEHYSNDGPPPLDDAYVVVNMTLDAKMELIYGCPAIFIHSYMLYGETRLLIDGDDDAAMSWVDYATAKQTERIMDELSLVWPLDAALTRYNQAVNRVNVARGVWPGPKMDWVVCHCREDLSWLGDPLYHIPRRSTLYIYEKCRETADTSTFRKRFASIVHVPDVADDDLRKDECIAYLHFLASRYDTMSDYVVFLQSDIEDHSKPGLFSTVMRSIEKGTFATHFVHLNYPRLVATQSDCKHATYKEIFGADPPGRLGTYCCAQFVASRQRIQQRDRSMYVRLAEMMDEPSPDGCNDIPGHSTHCLMYEVLWHILIGNHQPALPLRQDDSTLPTHLRVREEGSMTFLPGGSNFLSVVSDVWGVP